MELLQADRFYDSQNLISDENAVIKVFNNWAEYELGSITRYVGNPT